MASEHYGYLMLRPEMSVKIIVPPPSAAERFQHPSRMIRNALIVLLIASGVVAAAHDPQRFATGFLIGFASSRIVAH